MKELKTKAFNGKVRPSLYESLQHITYIRQEKINPLIEQWIENYVNEHQDDLDRWYEVFGSEEEKQAYYNHCDKR